MNLLSMLILALICVSCSHKNYEVIETIPTEITGNERLTCKRLNFEEAAAKFCIDSQKLRDPALVFVELDASGFATGTKCSLYNVSLMSNRVKLGEFVANEEGVLVTATKNSPMSSLNLTCGGQLRSETTYFTLVSEDQTLQITTPFVPIPIEARWEDGARASLSMVSGDGLTFIVQGKGFLPEEEFAYTSKTFDQITESIYSCDSEGKFEMTLSPAIQGEQGGCAQFIINRAIYKKPATFVYSWGNAAKQRR